ncbi:MAG TPA: SDR family NAD(P)-dependent oxidoreductase [bacterium]|nr:SDR family NAD(P)-dependent oxidoreductase [bacterium]
MTQACILITGASSGIGAALAEHYAARHGSGLTLGLVARRGERLSELAARLEPQGARVLTYVADVRDRADMADVVREFTATAGGVTLAIANAGRSSSDRLRHGDPAPGADTVITNVAGVIHTLQPLIPTLIAQGHGHLVAVGSVAGFRGIPGKGAYCASKAAVKMLMDAWRPELRIHGIRCTTICPGFVVSELTAENPYRMPFLMDTPKAARLIAGAIERGRRTYVFPWQMRLLAPLLQAVPERLLPTYAVRS